MASTQQSPLNLNQALSSGGLTLAGSTPIGIKTKSPTDTIKPPVKTTPQPQVQKPVGGGKTTEGGTQSTTPANYSADDNSRAAQLARSNPTTASTGSTNGSFSTATLAQQHQLNTQYNAGLKEDGISGPLTQAAIAKYSSTPSASAATGASSNTPYSVNNGLYGQLITGLANTSQKPNQAYTDAQAEAQKIQDQQTQVSKDYAQKTNNIAGTAGFLTQQSGLQGQLNNQYNTVQNALSSQYSGATSRLGAANQQQSLQQGALGTAAGLAAPQRNGYAFLDPLTGQPVGGANGANAAIDQGAAYTAREQGATGAAIDNQSIQGAQNNIDSITQLINSAGLNNSGINLQNATIQQLQKNLSNSDYQTLNNSLAAINQALSNVTGTPIDIAQLSTSQGTSLINTINNAVASAKGIAAGKVSGSGTTKSSGGANDWNSYLNQ